jgi:transcriptional regulator with XRE-family HTH domain
MRAGELLTQRDLAGRVGVAEQQVQRWEAHDHAGVNLERLQTRYRHLLFAPIPPVEGPTFWVVIMQIRF